MSFLCLHILLFSAQFTYIVGRVALLLAQTTINIRIDEALKKQVEYLFSEFGMNMTTAFTVFAKAVVRERKIPFEIYAEADGFYNEYYQERIKKSIASIDAGEGVARELVEMTDE